MCSRSDRSALVSGRSRSTDGTGRLPDDYGGFKFDLRRAGHTVNVVDQKIGGACPDLIGRNVDSAKRRIELRDDLEIGVACDRDILGHADPKRVALA